MQLSSKKQNINDSLSVISSLSNSSNLSNIIGNLNKDNDILNNNSKDPIIFIIVLLIKLVGIEVMKKVLSDVLSKGIGDLNTEIRNSLKSQLSGDDMDREVGNKMVNDGVTLSVKDIDYNGKLSQDGSVDDNTLDKEIKNSIDGNGIERDYNGLKVKYDNNTDSVTYKANTNQKMNTFMSNIIDNTVFVNEKRIISDVINLLFGTIIFSLLLNKKQVELDEKFNKIIKKVVENDGVTDSIFTLSPEDLNDIENTINDRTNGVFNLDFDCSVIGSEVDLETLNEILNSDDIYTTLDNTFNNILPSNNPDMGLYLGGSNQNDLNKLNSSIKNNDKFNNSTPTKEKIYKNFINGVTTTIIKNSILSPQNISLFYISKSILENNTQIYSGLDILKSQQNILDCLSKNIKSKITDILYRRLRKEVLKIVKPFGTAILNEKLDSYSKTITGLNVF
jgi:hypothetical protein